MAAVIPGLTPTRHDLLKEKDCVFSRSCQQSLQSLWSELDILFILRQEGILRMSLYWIYVPHPSVKVESTSSGEVEGGWIPRGKWGSYQKGVDIEEPPQGPLQHPCPTTSPQAPLCYLLFPDLSCALMSLNLCTHCPFHLGHCILCLQFHCVCLGAGQAGAGAGFHTSRVSYSSAQGWHFLSGDSVSFAGWRLSPARLVLCFRGESQDQTVTGTSDWLAVGQRVPWLSPQVPFIC